MGTRRIVSSLSNASDWGQFRGVTAQRDFPTAWDARAAAATFALGALLFVVACAITGATDEGSIAWATRAARTVPFVPVCGAVVTFLALRRAERRGELLALSSIGCSPARAAMFSVVGAAALSIVAAVGVASFRGAAVDAFFPRIVSHEAVRADGGTHGFVDTERGMRIASDGRLTRDKTASASASSHATHETSRAGSAAVVLFALGVGLPLMAARGARGERSAVIVAAIAMCVVCIFFLQVAAAGRAPPVLACIPAAALLIVALVRYRSPAW